MVLIERLDEKVVLGRKALSKPRVHEDVSSKGKNDKTNFLL